MGSLYNSIKGNTIEKPINSGGLYWAVKNPSPFSQHELRVQEMSKKIEEDMASTQKSLGFGSILKDTIKKVGSKIFDITPLGRVKEFQEQTETFTQPYLEKITPESKVGKVISTISRETSGASIGARIQSLSPYKTYEEAYKAIQTEMGDPNAPKVVKFIEKLTNSLPQQAIGVVLSVLNKPLSTLYWSALSADEQLQSKGKVSSITNIVIDTIGDQMLGASIESLLKSGGKSFVSSFLKNFGIESGTEVSQDLLKMVNEYDKAKTKEEKDKIVTQVKDYFKSGQILETAGIAGITGGLLGGGVQLAQGQQQTSMPTENTQQTIPPIIPPDGGSNTLYEAVKGKTTPTEQITPIEQITETTPETKPSGIAKRIETKAIEQGLIQSGFNQLAEYSPVVIKQQSEVISDLMNSDLETAKNMAIGKEKLDERITNGTMLFKAVENYATKNNDGELMLELAKSPYATQGSVSGQTLRLLQEYDDYSPIKKIQEVNSILETETKRKIKKPKQQELTEIKDTVKKNTEKVSKSAWEGFIEDITC